MDVYELTTPEVDVLAGWLREASEEGHPVRIAWDGGLKVKISEGMWSLPFGTQER